MSRNSPQLDPKHDDASIDIHLVARITPSDIIEGSILKGVLNRAFYPIDESLGVDGKFDEVENVQIYIFHKYKDTTYVICNIDTGGIQKKGSPVVAKVGKIEYNSTDGTYIFSIQHTRANITEDIPVGTFVPKSIESKIIEKVDTSSIQTRNLIRMRVLYVLNPAHVDGYTIPPDYSGWHEKIEKGAYLAGNLVKDTQKTTLALHVVANLGNGRIRIEHNGKYYLLAYDKASNTYSISNETGRKDYRGTFTLVDIHSDTFNLSED